MRRLTLPMAMVVASLALGVPAAAQDVAHPSHIHEGVCPAPGAIVATLGEVTSDLITDGGPAAGPLPVGVAPTTPIMSSVTTLDLPLASLVASPHSIVVHASAADMGTYLVCGNVGGRTMEIRVSPSRSPRSVVRVTAVWPSSTAPPPTPPSSACTWRRPELPSQEPPPLHSHRRHQHLPPSLRPGRA